MIAILTTIFHFACIWGFIEQVSPTMGSRKNQVNNTSLYRDISLTKKLLLYNSVKISDIIVNPKDGKEDFPDSVLKGVYIEKIRLMAERDFAAEPTTNFRLKFDEKLVYTTAKPVIRAIAMAGVRNAIFDISDQSINIELFKEISRNYMTHSGDKNGYNAIVLIKKDSLLLFDNSLGKNPNLVFKSPTFEADSFTREEIKSLESALSTVQTSGEDIKWVGLDPHPFTPLRKIFQIFRVINKLNQNNKSTWINSYLYGIFIPWGSDSVNEAKMTKICDSLKSHEPNAEIIPIYPISELNQSNASSVEVEISLDEQGKIEKVEIIRSGGKNFDLAVLEAISKSKFSAVCVDNSPINFKFRKTYKFEIGKDNQESIRDVVIESEKIK